MGHIYFVRHGQTVWNVENKICGATDIELTELGHEQAIKTGEEILKQGIQADEILYSPLIRAAETARHISEMTGIPRREEKRLIEQKFGKYESTPRNGAEFKLSKQNFADRYEGGESMLMLGQRIYNLLDELKFMSQYKTYIIVAHNGIARMVRSYFQDMTNADYAGYGIKNCEVMRFDFPDDGIFTKEAREAGVRDMYHDITKKLIEKKLCITTMESATSGQIASLISDTEGSSAVLKGAFVTYSNEAKIQQGVSAEIIEKSGVYSVETAQAMSRACREAYGADIGIGVTGTMGNVDPANHDSVPGDVFFAIDYKGVTHTFARTIAPQETRLAYKLEVAGMVGEQLLKLMNQ